MMLVKFGSRADCWKHTHGLALAKNTEDQEGLKEEEDDDEDQGYKLI